MGAKRMELKKIDGKGLTEEIYHAGYSIRGLAKEIGSISEATIRRYLKRNEMPDYLLTDIDHVINPKNHGILVHLMVFAKVTDGYLDWILNSAKRENGTYGNYYFSNDEAEMLLNDAVVYGQHYVRGNVLQHVSKEFELEMLTYEEYKKMKKGVNKK